MAAAASNNVNLPIAHFRADKLEDVKEELFAFAKEASAGIAYVNVTEHRHVFLIKQKKIYTGGLDVPVSIEHHPDQVTIKVDRFALLYWRNGEVVAHEECYQSYLDLLDVEIPPRLTLYPAATE